MKPIFIPSALQIQNALPRSAKRHVAAVALVTISCWVSAAFAQVKGPSMAPTQDTPSRSEYFSWINNAWEGATEAQSLINLRFFKWLHDAYGMQLDLYSLDAGNIDTQNHYGQTDSADFRAKFPSGLAPLNALASSFGCRLGMWLGPDGFGNTPAEEQARKEMVLSLCRDDRIALLKLDQCASPLRPEKQAALRDLLAACRQYVPDLIVLNHRNDMGVATPQVTTTLWEGKETYIDVYSANAVTAPHHRADTLARGIPPQLNRLMEDHGVCISSCLDGWDDDLILQAFNRCLILAPEIYGNPWLLRDDEFSKLARIFNLHRKYRDLLVRGMLLPEDQYGKTAVSRGDGATRFITLRNLTWEPENRKIKLDASIGLTDGGQIELRQFHPIERIIGRYAPGAEVNVEVPAFRSILLCASSRPMDEIGVEGADYQVICDVPNQPAEIAVVGAPGASLAVKLAGPHRGWKKATLDGRDAIPLLAGGTLTVTLPGDPIPPGPWPRKLGELQPIAVPDDAEALYEATCFAADSNSLEMRSLARAGATHIPQVQAARDALAFDPKAVGFGLWDHFAFDGDPNTAFRSNRGQAVDGGCFRIDLGEAVALRQLTFRKADLHPAYMPAAADISADLKKWTSVPLTRQGDDWILALQDRPAARFIRIVGAMTAVAEIEGVSPAGAPADRSKWRASNLLAPYAKRSAKRAWSYSAILSKVPDGATLAVAVNGQYGVEGAYAAAEIDGAYIGAFDRAPSYPSNIWESGPVTADQNYTYFIPLTPAMSGKTMRMVVMQNTGTAGEVGPVAWECCNDHAKQSVQLQLRQ